MAFRRFTEEARRVVIRAKQNARIINHQWIDEMHFLLALVQAEDNVAAILLMTAGPERAEMEREVESRIPRVAGVAPEGDIPFSPSAKRFLEVSGEEAERLEHDYIGCEHFLLSLLRQERTHQLLSGFGITLGRIETLIRDVDHMLDLA